jgi:hypothetical protein
VQIFILLCADYNHFFAEPQEISALAKIEVKLFKLKSQETISRFCSRDAILYSREKIIFGR